MANTLYEKDFYAWTVETAKALKEKAFNKVDIEHLVEEVESMGASERRELASRLEQLLMHLLKLKYQSNYINTSSWVRSIKEQRKRLAKLLKTQPSLKNLVNDEVDDSYQLAILKASEETGLKEEVFPSECPFTVEQILDESFYPAT